MGNSAKIARIRTSLSFMDWSARVKELLAIADIELTEEEQRQLRFYHLSGVRAWTVAEQIIEMKLAAVRKG